jgi:hypothetical protein
VTRVAFEHSPGRSDPRYAADNSAFDVYIEYVTPSGGSGFVGVEVKYVEDMSDQPARHRERYDEVADLMACFEPTERRRLRAVPLNQIWRDHLLAGSMVLERESPWSEGRFSTLIAIRVAAVGARSARSTASTSRSRRASSAFSSKHASAGASVLGSRRSVAS